MASNVSVLSGGEGSARLEQETTASSSGGGGDSIVGEARPQADPLPSKRGEIGYRESLHASQSQNDHSVSPLPARHPADRDRDLPPNLSATSPNGNDDADSSRSMRKHSLPMLPKVGGIRLISLALLVFQLLILAGTIAAWAVAAMRIPSQPKSSGPMSINSSQIFVHVAFTIAMLLQFVFLERIIFRVRAERYAFKHPGEILPTSRNRSGNSSGRALAIAPWHRPPLPTYAAALAQNGHGTGDVEDNIIAVPPPPAYGHTRGSTLLLANFTNDSLRAQRSRERVRESRGTVRASRFSMLSGRSDRPVSYRSHDSDWEVRVDAHRSLQLAETLARLENGGEEPESSPSNSSTNRN